MFTSIPTTSCCKTYWRVLLILMGRLKSWVVFQQPTVLSYHQFLHSCPSESWVARKVALNSYKIVSDWTRQILWSSPPNYLWTTLLNASFWTHLLNQSDSVIITADLSSGDCSEWFVLDPSVAIACCSKSSAAHEVGLNPTKSWVTQRGQILWGRLLPPGAWTHPLQ